MSGLRIIQAGEKTKLNTRTCGSGKPLRSMFTGQEALLIKGFLNGFEVRTWNGSYPFIDRNDPNGEWVIYIPEGGAGAPLFSGRVWVAGKLFEVGELTGRYVRVEKGIGDTINVTRTNSPMPDPMPANESWRDTRQCAGDIYIDC